MKLRIKLSTNSDTYRVYNYIYDALERKDYKLYGEKPIHICFSKVFSVMYSSFGWNKIRNYTFPKDGNISLEKKDEYFYLYAHIKSSESLVFYSSLLMLVALVFGLRLNLELLYILLFLISIPGILYVVYYLKARGFINDLISDDFLA
jgi:hypothetical protein